MFCEYTVSTNHISWSFNIYVTCMCITIWADSDGSLYCKNKWFAKCKILTNQKYNYYMLVGDKIILTPQNMHPTQTYFSLLPQTIIWFWDNNNLIEKIASKTVKISSILLLCSHLIRIFFTLVQIVYISLKLRHLHLA